MFDKSNQTYIYMFLLDFQMAHDTKKISKGSAMWLALSHEKSAGSDLGHASVCLSLPINLESAYIVLSGLELSVDDVWNRRIHFRGQHRRSHP